MASGPSLSEMLLIVLVPLVVFGGMAAALFGFIFGIVKRRPGVIAASVAAPFLLLVVAAMFVWTARTTSMGHVYQSQAIGVPAVEMPPMPSMPPFPSMPGAHGVPGVIEVRSIVTPSWVKLTILLLVAAGVIAVAKKIANRDGEWGGGWVKPLVIGVLVIVVFNFVAMRASYERTQAIHARAMARQQEERARHNAEVLRKVRVDHRQHADAAVQRANALLASHSMQEMWDKVTRPRIQLDEVKTVAAVESPVGEATQAVALDAAKTPESMENSLARLERMVAQVTAVADQVSDTGTLIGKAMVALNETMDSRRKSLSTLAPSAAQPVLQVAAVQANDTDDKLAPAKAEDELQIAADAVVESSSVPRPAWVDEAPKTVGNVRRQVLVAGEFATREECDREMDLQLFRATYNRIRELSHAGEGPLSDTGPEFAYTTLPGQAHPISGSEFAAIQLGRSGIVGIDYIRREIAKQEFSETVDRSFGPMQKLYTQIEFTKSVDDELLRRWDVFRRSERFVQVGFGAGGVLGMIGLALGLMKVDTWTKGYYTKRLFLGVPAAIIGGLALLLGIAG
jgi:hypothetical protein